MRTRSQTAPLVAGEATAGSSKPALAPKGGGQADLSKRSLAGRGPAPAGRSQGPSQHPILPFGAGLALSLSEGDPPTPCLRVEVIAQTHLIHAHDSTQG